MEFAHFGSTTWSDPLEVTHDPSDLERGCWAVVVTFEGELTAVRFGRRHEGGVPPGDARRWPGTTGWRPTLDSRGYVDGVEEIRRRIAAGTVYQVNLTTLLEAPLPEEAHLPDLAAVLAPHLGRLTDGFTAVLVTAGIFGVLHIGGHGPLFIGPMFLGAILGWARLRSRGMGAPITLHMMLNGTAMTLALTLGLE